MEKMQVNGVPLTLRIQEQVRDMGGGWSSLCSREEQSEHWKVKCRPLIGVWFFLV